MRLLAGLATACLVLLANPVSGQPAPADSTATLAADSEHNGALFDRTKPVQFYNSGRFSRGTLKSDFSLGSATYAAGTDLFFYEDGTVLSGTLRDDAPIRDVGFAKGLVQFHPNGAVASGSVKPPFTQKNLQVAFPAVVEFSPQGRVLRVGATQGVSFRLLGRTLRQSATLAYNEREDGYRLVDGTVGAPTIVAHVVTKRNALGIPIAGEAVIMPADSTFALFMNDPVFGQGQQPFDRYIPPGRFIINGIDFGGNLPRVHVRDMRVLSVQIQQDMVIQGRQYRVNDVVLLDPFGRVAHPPL